MSIIYTDKNGLEHKTAGKEIPGIASDTSFGVVQFTDSTEVMSNNGLALSATEKNKNIPGSLAAQMNEIDALLGDTPLPLGDGTVTSALMKIRDEIAELNNKFNMQPQFVAGLKDNVTPLDTIWTSKAKMYQVSTDSCDFAYINAYDHIELKPGLYYIDVQFYATGNGNIMNAMSMGNAKQIWGIINPSGSAKAVMMNGGFLLEVNATSQFPFAFASDSFTVVSYDISGGVSRVTVTKLK